MKLKILLVEHDKQVLEAVTGMLENLGHEVVMAGSPIEGKKLLQKLTVFEPDYDIIMSDCNFEFQREGVLFLHEAGAYYRFMGKPLVRILISGGGEIQKMAALANAIPLAKPFGIKELEKVLSLATRPSLKLEQVAVGQN